LILIAINQHYIISYIYEIFQNASNYIEVDLCISILNQLLKNVSYKTVTVMLFL